MILARVYKIGKGNVLRVFAGCPTYTDTENYTEVQKNNFNQGQKVSTLKILSQNPN